jgi:hypothetical protein
MNQAKNCQPRHAVLNGVPSGFRRTLMCNLIPLVAIVLMSQCSCDRQQTPQKLQPPALSGTASLEIDFRQEGMKNFQFDGLPLTPEMTVADLMRAAAKQSRESETAGEKLELEMSGSGETAFLVSLNGLPNGKSGDADERFWIYYLNGSKADLGCGAAKLKPGDAVRWVHEAYQP